MLRTLLVLLIAYGISLTASATEFIADLAHNGVVDRVVVSTAGAQGVVEFFEKGHSIGRFEHLLSDAPSLQASVAPQLGGGAVLVVDSDGSRRKFHLIAPIYKLGPRLVISCVYKAMYDAVDESRSVGSMCRQIELSKLDIATLIGDEGLFAYDNGQSWAQLVGEEKCLRPAGFRYGAYVVVRCSADGPSGATKGASQFIFDQTGKRLFSLDGYDFYPGQDGDKFFLNTDLSAMTIGVSGSLGCMAGHDRQASALEGSTHLAQKYAIDYSLGHDSDCYRGSYAYRGRPRSLSLNGHLDNGLIQLLETDPDGRVSGIFLVRDLNAHWSGQWIGVPARLPLAVN